MVKLQNMLDKQPPRLQAVILIIGKQPNPHQVKGL